MARQRAAFTNVWSVRASNGRGSAGRAELRLGLAWPKSAIASWPVKVLSSASCELFKRQAVGAAAEASDQFSELAEVFFSSFIAGSVCAMVSA
jgi:hypothetical protein